jgi:predicted acyltransferase
MSTETPNRLISLDVFRGMTIAGMVLVNNPGTWSAIYPPLKHAEWHGITPTDYVFPFFLFIVGVAIPLALGRRLEAAASNDGGGLPTDIYWKIVKRAILIFFLGLFLAAFPFFDYAKSDVPTWAKIAVMMLIPAALYFWLTGKPVISLVLLGAVVLAAVGFYLAGYALFVNNFENLRIMGVLQRIAVCYLIAGLIFLHTNWRQQAIIAGALLLLYWALMSWIPVPGCEATTFNDKACNLAAYLDRTILGENHIWRSAKVYDPEGLLSTIPAVSTALAGVLAGQWLRKKTDDYEKVSGFFFFGVSLLALGYLWSLAFPINKPLWTSSYVVYTAGLALCFLGFCYWLIDIKGFKAWTKPFVIFGVNALALYVGSGVMARILGLIKVSGANGGADISLQKWIFDTIYLPLASPVNASLLYAVSFILAWLLLMWLLYRKGIYIKV